MSGGARLLEAVTLGDMNENRLERRESENEWCAAGIRVTRVGNVRKAKDGKCSESFRQPTYRSAYKVEIPQRLIDFDLYRLLYVHAGCMCVKYQVPL